jgi:hypothetical protein
VSQESEKQQGPNFEAILIDIALDNWRFAKVFERILEKLDAGQGARFANQCNYFLKRLKEGLEKANLRIVDVSGQAFDPGLAVTPLNIEDFESDDQLLVDQMVEPIIMGPEGLLRSGTVILRKAK